jgi:hypothetical protein
MINFGKTGTGFFFFVFFIARALARSNRSAAELNDLIQKNKKHKSGLLRHFIPRNDALFCLLLSVIFKLLNI